MGLKGNQGNLFFDVKEYFGDMEFRTRIKETGDYRKTQEEAHSQLEARDYYAQNSSELGKI